MAFREFTGELDAAPPSGPVREFTGELDAPDAQAAQPPEPSMGAVALNAVPKGVANLVNTPHAINSLVIRGLANLPGLEYVPQVKEFLETLANHPEINRNYPMELARKAGLVNPENEPQTGPQRIVDAAIQNAVQSAAIPMGGSLNTAKSVLMGATSGAAAQSTKEATGSDLLAGIVGVGTSLLPTAIANNLPSRTKNILPAKTGQDSIRAGQAMGLVAEPSKVRGPSSIIEGAAGKAAIRQAAIEHNQPIVNRNAAIDIGLPADAPLSRDLLDTYKKTVMAPYDQVDDALKAARQSGSMEYFPRYHSESLKDEYIAAGQHVNALWSTYKNNPDINLLKSIDAAKSKQESVFKDIMAVAQASGNPKLPKQVLNAKQLYAKINDVESALNPGSGNVSLEELGSLAKAGRKFTGRLKDLANFGLEQSRLSTPLEKIPPSGVSGTDAALAATLGTSGSSAGWFGMGIPFVRGMAKNHVLSPQYQQSLLDIAIPKTPWAPIAARSAMVGKSAADTSGERK